MRAHGRLPPRISFGRRVGELARRHPAQPALVFAPAAGAERTVTWTRLHEDSNRVARLLVSMGADEHSLVAVVLPNSVEHYLATIAAWKLGACVLPLSPGLPPRARQEVLQAAQATMVIDDAAALEAAANFSSGPLQDRVPQPGRAAASGGSTGRPKVIVDPAPWAFVPGELVAALGPPIGLREGQVQLVAAPLYHGVPFLRSHFGLFEDHTLVVMDRFDAARVVDLIERHRVSFGFLVPTMMARIIRLEGIRARDFSSIEALAHGGAPCPPWLKRAWIDLVGAEHLYETFGAAELPGMTAIRGDEWLRHSGSVGRPWNADLIILNDAGNAVPPGLVGEIFLRDRTRPGAAYEYRGGQAPPATPDGFVSAGDLGWVSEDGYLFVADRRTDLIISGGVNVYAAEVEAALTEHPRVADAAVVGLPDDDWGKRVHAIVQPVDAGHPPSPAELDAHCRQRLPPSRVPKTYEFVAQLPRDDAGKIQRGALVAERASVAP